MRLSGWGFYQRELRSGVFPMACLWSISRGSICSLNGTIILTKLFANYNHNYLYANPVGTHMDWYTASQLCCTHSSSCFFLFAAILTNHRVVFLFCWIPKKPLKHDLFCVFRKTSPITKPENPLQPPHNNNNRHTHDFNDSPIYHSTVWSERRTWWMQTPYLCIHGYFLESIKET